MKQIVIDFSQSKLRTALVEDGKLVEVLIDDPKSPQIIGNVYVGLVKRVLPNGFVFIDIGLKDCVFMDCGRRKRMFKHGDRIVVQIIRGGRGVKGAIAATEICFTGRYAVLSNSPAIGVSKKIENKSERKRLKKLAKELLPEGCGVIVRTSASEADSDVFATELKNLHRLLKKTLEYGQYAKAPSAIYEKDHLLYGTLQAVMDNSVTEIAINKADEIAALGGVLTELGYGDGLLKVVDAPDIFTYYHIGSAFEKAFEPRAWLNSGGYIVIEQTEACVVIDVNTGKSTRKASQFTTNCEAAVEIARQLRLRNLSGMIIIDFIDMSKPDDKRKLQQILEQEVKKDRVRVNVVGMTKLGLMQLTRKRTGKTLGES